MSKVLGSLFVVAVLFVATFFTMTKEKEVIVLTKENFVEKTKSGIVLVDFYADWCGPCMELKQTLKKVTGAKIGKVNIDIENDLQNDYNVQSIPTIVFMKDGKEKSRLVGNHSLETIQAEIDKLKE